jgi:hypothetical protein
MEEFEPRNAFEHIDKLAYEIGPRLAGTRGDRMAAEYIQEKLRSYGFKPQVQVFKFVSRQARLKATACLLAAAFIASLFLPPEFSLLTWSAALVVWRSLEKIMPKRESQNIIALQKAEGVQKRVALTAHYDSAPCTVSHRLHLFLKFTLLPAISLVSIVLALHALKLVPAWWLVWTILALFFLPICAGLFISASARRVSPGANDNASGVAVMLEAARVLAESPPQGVELAFIALGAEEQGLVGARMLVKERLLPPDTHALNLDMVGAGSQAYIIEGNGILRKTRTSTPLNQVLADSIQRAGLKPKLFWSALAGHDHIPLLRAKLLATTFSFDTGGVDRLGQRIAKLFRLPNARTRRYRHTHTHDDIPDHLELTSIERAGAVVLDFVKSI